MPQILQFTISPKVPYGTLYQVTYPHPHQNAISSQSVSSVYHDHSFLFFTFVDDFSKYTWIIIRRNKAKTIQNVINFVEMVEVQHNSHIKIIRNNNGPKFLMPRFYALKGIIHQSSCVESLNKRKINTLLILLKLLYFKPISLIPFGHLLLLMPYIFQEHY